MLVWDSGQDSAESGADKHSDCATGKYENLKETIACYSERIAIQLPGWYHIPIIEINYEG
jgi:hypothetical protein